MRRHYLIAAVAWLAISPSLFAQTTVSLDPSTARFTYFPSGEGPGVPGGVPNAYELHFGMQGMFTIEEQPNDQGDITQAEFVLLGNEAAFQNNPQHRAQLEEASRQILLTAMFDVERGPPLDRTVYRADVAGPDLVLEFFRETLVRMDGGPDQRPVDGEGFRYSYPVPEPSTNALLLTSCSCVGLWRAVRSRPRILLGTPCVALRFRTIGTATL